MACAPVVYRKAAGSIPARSVQGKYVDSKRLDALLLRLVESERDKARAMIALAEIAGITDIGYWQWIDAQKYTRFDLAGVDPQGKLRFLEE